MNIRSLVAAANVGVVFLLGAGIAAQAAEVRVLSSYGMRDVLVGIHAKFEAATGHTVAVNFANPRLIEKRIQDRETVDVVIGGDIDFAKGQFVPGSVTPIARGVLGVAVRKGAPKPDISSPDAVKRALIAAKSISYNHDGAPFIHFVQVLERWGIADEMKQKTILGKTPPRRVGDLVANGEAEIGVHPISLLMSVPGIDLIGPLPNDLQLAGDGHSAAIMAGAKDMGAARALVDFLHSPEAVAVIKAKGLAPAAP